MTPTSLATLLRFHRFHLELTRRLDHRLGALHGLSFSDFILLRALALAPAGRLPRSDLALEVGLTASGVTRALLPLEKLGLIVREANERDARVSYAALTPAGLALVEHAAITTEQISQDVLGKLSTEGQMQFLQLVEEIGR